MKIWKRKRKRKEIAPPSHICSEGGVLLPFICHSLLFVVPHCSLFPVVCCSPSFIIPCHLLFPVVCHSLPLVICIVCYLFTVVCCSPSWSSLSAPPYLPMSSCKGTSHFRPFSTFQTLFQVILSSRSPVSACFKAQNSFSGISTHKNVFWPMYDSRNTFLASQIIQNPFTPYSVPPLPRADGSTPSTIVLHVVTIIQNVSHHM